jgi:hypothetical protein
MIKILEEFLKSLFLFPNLFLETIKCFENWTLHKLLIQNWCISISI